MSDRFYADETSDGWYVFDSANGHRRASQRIAPGGCLVENLNRYDGQPHTCSYEDPASDLYCDHCSLDRILATAEDNTLSILGASPDAKSEQVGTVTLTARRPREVQSAGDCAAWHYVLDVEPQTVPVYSNGYYASWGFEGVVVGGDLASRFGGNLIGGEDPIVREIGTTKSVVHHPYAYSVERGRYTKGDLEFDIR